MKRNKLRLFVLATLRVSMVVVMTCCLYAMFVGKSKVVGALLFIALLAFLAFGYVYAELVNLAVWVLNERCDRFAVRLSRLDGLDEVDDLYAITRDDPDVFRR